MHCITVARQPIIHFLKNCLQFNLSVSHYCATNPEPILRAELLKDPSLCREQSSFVPVFSFSAPSAANPPVLQSSSRLVFLQHNDALCDKTCWANCGGYSHQCRLTRACLRGLVGQVGPEVQVDPSEIRSRRKSQTVDFFSDYILKLVNDATL